MFISGFIVLSICDKKNQININIYVIVYVDFKNNVDMYTYVGGTFESHFFQNVFLSLCNVSLRY